MGSEIYLAPIRRYPPGIPERIALSPSRLLKFVTPLRTVGTTNIMDDTPTNTDERHRIANSQVCRVNDERWLLATAAKRISIHF
jgi:hypothetical protein